MNFEKFYQSSFVNRGIAVVLGAAEVIADQIAPRLAKKYPVSIEKDILVPTWDQKTTLIDLYTPKGEKPKDGWPVALMIHGGGFRFFSKDSHALIAAQVAEMGYLTVAMNYRLAPQHPYPEGLTDAFSVYDWMQKEIKAFGGNRENISLISESAGSNFSLNICLVASGNATIPFKPEEADLTTWPIPKKAVLHCGYFQVSNTARFTEETNPSAIVRSRVQMIQKNYLPDSIKNPDQRDWGLADPLCILENLLKNGAKLNSAFPETFIPIGGNDPVLEDARRLEKVLLALGAKTKLKIYPGAPHAFYGMPWHSRYKEIWQDIRSFFKAGNL